MHNKDTSNNNFSFIIFTQKSFNIIKCKHFVYIYIRTGYIFQQFYDLTYKHPRQRVINHKIKKWNKKILREKDIFPRINLAQMDPPRVQNL